MVLFVRELEGHFFILSLLMEVGNSSFNITGPDRLVQSENAADTQMMYIVISMSHTNGKCMLQN